MAWKVITFLAIFALSEARPPTSEQRVEIENWLSHSGSQESENHEAHAASYPAYEFTYEVSDPHTHDFKGHHEQRKGDDVKGYYWLVQPDGLKRTVKYHVDKHSGFKAHVDYAKHWEESNNNQESEVGGEANEEENNSSENENNNNEKTEENGQENENNSGENESEGEEENENNNTGMKEEEQRREKEESWKLVHYNLRKLNSRRGNEENNRERELKATEGIWKPRHWGKRRNEQSRRDESEEQNEKNEENEGRNGNENGNEGGESTEEENQESRGHSNWEKWQKGRRRNESGRGKRGNKGKKEERRQVNEENENGERNEENQEEQRNEGNEEGAERSEINDKGKIIKTEYHVIIHHPKYKTKHSEGHK